MPAAGLERGVRTDEENKRSYLQLRCPDRCPIQLLSIAGSHPHASRDPRERPAWPSLPAALQSWGAGACAAPAHTLLVNACMIVPFAVMSEHYLLIGASFAQGLQAEMTHHAGTGCIIEIQSPASIGVHSCLLTTWSFTFNIAERSYAQTTVQ